MEDQEYHDGTDEYLQFSANLKKGKAKVLFGETGELEASLRKLKGKASIGDVKVDAEYKYDGEWKARAKAPVFGGIAEGEITSAGDWQVKMAKPLFGGEVSLDANEVGGQRRYYVQWGKTF